MHVCGKMWLWLIGFGLVQCVGWMNEKIPSLIYKCFRAIFIILKDKRVYCVTQELCLQKTYQDVPRKKWKTCHKSQDSCACTSFLCMHNTLVHAQHSCACTGGARDQGRDPKKALGSGLRQRFFGSQPWSLAPQVHARGVLCMHKSVVHAQETCACTRILTNKTYQDVPMVTNSH